MPRQGRSGGGSRGPSRPSIAPQRPTAPPKQQTRPATTAAYPQNGTRTATPTVPSQAQTQSQGPGLFGQMASTAAGVAVGSSIGHAIGGLFGGGSTTAAGSEPSAVASQGQEQERHNSWGPRSCDADAKQFTKCLDENQGNMQICGWYLEQLKACQATASQY